MNKNNVKIANFVEKASKSCNCLVNYDVIPEENGIFVRVFKWDKIAEFNEDREEGDYIKESSELAVPNHCNLLCYGGFKHKEINIIFNE